MTNVYIIIIASTSITTKNINIIAPISPKNSVPLANPNIIPNIINSIHTALLYAGISFILL